MYAMECPDALRSGEGSGLKRGPGGGGGGRGRGTRRGRWRMEDVVRAAAAGQGAWGQRVESIVCQMQTVGSLRRASLDTPAGRVETRDGESRVNFVEENLGGRSASLRLLDCGHAVSWRARSGRLELNDGQRHLGGFSTKFVNTIGPFEGVGRLRCLFGGGWGWQMARGRDVERGSGAREAFDQTFFLHRGGGALAWAGPPDSPLGPAPVTPTCGARSWGSLSPSMDHLQLAAGSFHPKHGGNPRARAPKHDLSGLPDRP